MTNNHVMARDCPGRTPKLFLLGFSLCFCILTNNVSSDSLQTETEVLSERLVRIKRELEEKKESMEKLRNMERRILGELLDLEERMDLNQGLIQRLGKEEKNIRRELRRGESNLKESEWRLSSCRKHLDLTLRALFKHGRIGPCDMIFGTTSPLDLMNELRSAKKIMAEDQRKLKATGTLKNELEEKKENLSRTRPEVCRLKYKKEEERMVQEIDLKEKEKLLKKIKSEKKLCVQAIQELEKDVFEVSEILGQLQPEFFPDGTGKGEGENWFGSLRGKLDWPVEGRVVSHFGEQSHPRFYTKIQNQGIEIQTRSRAEVRAVAGGKVVYVSRLRGFGEFLILQHDAEYYTLYARLSEILVTTGDQVERLEKIARVGDDKMATRPCLHLEIRKGKRSLDPLEWLR
jgi:septal ring factor EnvC (AmiA/AmiB activator)